MKQILTTAVGITALTILSSLGVAANSSTQSPSFSEQVAPIVFNRCTVCHRPGEAAPFTLMNYADVKKRGKLIAKVVQKRFMPPWPVKSTDYTFANDRSLSDEEIGTITDWVKNGMPEGDSKKTPSLPAFVEGWQLGTPDLVVRMTEAYTLHAEGPDIYRNFVIPLNLGEDKWVRAIEFRPGARSIVHHSLFYYDTTGEAREQDAKDPVPGFRRMGQGLQRNSVGGWAVGGLPQFLPDGLAYKLPKGSDLILSTHFHPLGKKEKEISTVGIYFADGPPKRGFTAIQLPPVFGALAGVVIPAGEADYRKQESFVLPVDIKVFGVSAHAHYLGKSMKMTATLPGGETRQLVSIPNWDFSWQEEYRYSSELFLPKGTRLDGEVVWDNSADNISNPNNPPKPVRWGRESTDEMGCVTLMVMAANPSELTKLNSVIRDQVRKAASTSIANRFAGGEGEQRGTLLKRIIEKFDTDGDGKLNDAERAEARKFYRGNRF